MTLANFNSNFNWQYRMLKQAAECCGVVPELGPSPPACLCYDLIGPEQGSAVFSFKTCDGIDGGGTINTFEHMTICALENSIQIISFTVPNKPPSFLARNQICNQSIDLNCTLCYYYLQISDPVCYSFNTYAVDWDLNGYQFFNWNTMMGTVPYGQNSIGTNYGGYAVQFSDPSNFCGPSTYNDFYFWTVANEKFPPPSLIGNDSQGNSVTYDFLGPICNFKCYDGTFTSLFGSQYMIGFISTEVYASDNTLFVDLESPTASNDLSNALAFWYNVNTFSASVTALGGFTYRIQIFVLYSNGATFDICMSDSTIGQLNSVPC